MPLDETNEIHTSWAQAKTAAQASLRQIRQRQQEIWEDRDTGEWEDLFGMQSALTAILFQRDPWSDWLRPSQLAHGGAYKIRSRNLSHGVWNEKTQGFVGIREKFNSLYLDTEYHHDTGGSFGTARPEEFVGMCPIEDLAEGHSRCTEHDRPTESRRYTGDSNGWGWWFHADDGTMLPRIEERVEGQPYDSTHRVGNKPLFDWLAELERNSTET